MSTRHTLRHNPAGEKITASDDVIARMLQDASIPTLMMSMIHMSGDASLLNGTIRPLGVYLNEFQGYMSEDDQAAIRAQALQVIKAYRDRGCTLPPAPSHQAINDMMSFMVATPVPPDYVPMMLEEMELDGIDARTVSFDDVKVDVKNHFNVVVIGGGMSGVLAAIRLQEAGIAYTVFEKNPSVGGTWFENTYPGCRVDVGNHFYCYSFAPNPAWTQFFAQQPELRNYFEDCIRDFDVQKNFRFNSEVESASWSETEKRWQVVVRKADGSRETVTANAVISAVGQLNRPKIPTIKGRDTFKGAQFHSAQWQHDVDLKGKRVAVVGSGASAFQLVPEVAKQAGQLYVYQRSAPWMFENKDYHTDVSDSIRWCLQHLPYYARWYRFLIFWPGCDGIFDSLRVDPNWPHQDRSINEFNDMIRTIFTDYISQQVGDDQALLKKVIPDYAPLGKRTLQDNGTWLAALKRDNVELIASEVTQIDGNTVVAGNGERRDVDVIIYATGFNANKYLWPMTISGRDGIVLSEQWGDVPEAYLGITVPNFPNLFCLYGPATNLAFGGSLIFNGECQMRYVMSCIKTMLQQNAKSIEIKKDIHDDYNRRVQDEHAGMVWAHPSVRGSWYQNSSGRVTILSPWRLLDYWTWTREVDESHYTFG
jgi:4-hydroxyacetophenone monooxygenase